MPNCSSLPCFLTLLCWCLLASPPRESSVSAVDEGEERRRWLPWMLLVLLIIGVGIAIFFIVRAMKREEEESTSRNSSLRRPDQGKIERFSSCGDGDESPLITRLRDTAKQTTILHYEMVQSQWNQAETPWVNTSSRALSGTLNSGSSVCFCSFKRSLQTHVPAAS